MNPNTAIVKYTYIHTSRMAHKTITISEDAYEALAKAKDENESFTKAILRLTSERGKAGAFLRYLEATPADEELAKNVEAAMRVTRKAKLGRADLD